MLALSSHKSKQFYVFVCTRNEYIKITKSITVTEESSSSGDDDDNDDDEWRSATRTESSLTRTLTFGANSTFTVTWRSSKFVIIRCIIFDKQH